MDSNAKQPRIRRWLVPVCAGFAISSLALAETSPHGDKVQASESAQWMTGFPPAADRVITNADADFFDAPKLHWTVCHLRELLPTKNVSRGIGAPGYLEYNLDPAIGKLSFERMDTGETMTWNQAFDANYTDGIVILHHGKVIYERYAGCLDEEGTHAAMSMTKSLTGLLAEMLIAEGVIDETALAGDLIPELRDSAFGNATVRQILNMTTGLQYSEDYSDPNADVWQYSAAASPLPKPEGYEGPRSYFDYLQTVEPKGEHDDAFAYKTINSDAMGWIIARSSGKSVSELLSDRIWKPMGAEQAAYYTIDSIGIPFAGGGLNAGLRDIARIGQLMLSEGKFNDKQLIPAAAVRNIRTGGDPELFAKAGYTSMPNGSYKSMWWFFHNDNEAYAARGVHGQTIYIDPAADMVIARFASHPQAANAGNDATSLPMYQAVADHLME